MAQQGLESEPDSTEHKRLCVAKHWSGQNLKREGRLREARAAWQLCAQQKCPAIVRADCLAWADEANALIPTVVVSAKGDEGDLFQVKVFVDDVLVATELDGKPIELDSGARVFRFETDRHPPIERRILLSQGQRHRLIAVSFAETRAPDAASQPGESAVLHRPTPTLSYVLGAGALVGLATFGAASLLALDQKKALEASCAPSCSKAQIASVNSKFVIADVGLASALVSGVLAGYLYITRSAVPVDERAARGTRPKLRAEINVGPEALAVSLKGEL